MELAVDRPIAYKGRMYDLLSAGRLGNTVPMWFSVEAWEADPLAAQYSVWGVRTLTPGGPCRLYCPRGEVAATARSPEYAKHGVNISVMLDAVATVTLYADVYDSEKGIIVYCVEHPGKGASWRKVMPEKGRQLEGVAARMILEKHLNASSLADLYALFDRWPGHVVELSAVSRCLGTIPGRNAVVWEVRNY
jgi:hypothetical protein